jgi:uridine phosphorylase
METAGIYAMASLLGHRAISLNAILANRATGEFAAHPDKTVAALIEKTLEILASF